MHQLILRISVALVSVLLTACGGGGTSGTTLNSNSLTENSNTSLPSDVIEVISASEPPDVTPATFTALRSIQPGDVIGTIIVDGQYSQRSLLDRNTGQISTDFMINDNHQLVVLRTPSQAATRIILDAIFTATDDQSRTTTEIVVDLSADFLGTTAKVIPLGDSITHGYNSISYRYPLKQMTENDSNVSIDFIGTQNRPDIFSDTQHEGFPGYRSDEILNGRSGIPSLANRLQNMAVPDFVLLHVGTNDMLQGYSDDHAISHIRSMITTLRNRNSSIIILLAQIVPSTNSSQVQTRIPQFNQRIAQLKAEMHTANSPVVLVDMFSGLSGADLSDSIHPNSQGEEKMAQRWFGALLPFFDGFP